MKKLALLLVATVVALVGVGAVRGLRLESHQVEPGTPAAVTVDAPAAATRLAGAVRLPTISWGGTRPRDAAAFTALHSYLAEQFPVVMQTLTRETIAGLSLLYTWPGVDRQLPPVILGAHLDVVPAEETTTGAWKHPPFSGTIADQSVWGRGTIDNKSGVLGLLEAIGILIRSGYKPTRTIYLAFGHNEEGDTDASGAKAIARELAARGVSGATMLDEGGLIYDRVKNVPRAVALVGVAEKGTVNFELRANAAGGHASMPPRRSAIGILARALDRLERHAMPARLDGAVSEMFRVLAPEMTVPMRVAFANLRVTRPIVLWQLGQQPETNAVIRTTLAPTMLEGSPKHNVLATSARAVVNVRLLPGDSAAIVEAHIRRVVDDERISVSVIGPASEASAVSATDTAEFAALQRAIRAIYPDVIVAPYLTVGATDSRHYSAITTNTYRFLPVYQDGALEAIHGVNEHVRIDAYEKAIRIYATVIKEFAGKQ